MTKKESIFLFHQNRFKVLDIQMKKYRTFLNFLVWFIRNIFKFVFDPTLTNPTNILLILVLIWIFHNRNSGYLLTQYKLLRGIKFNFSLLDNKMSPSINSSWTVPHIMKPIKRVIIIKYLRNQNSFFLANAIEWDIQMSQRRFFPTNSLYKQ